MDKHQKDNTILTVTTEFGTATYMPVLPYTQQPVANQFDINVYVMNLLKKRYLVYKIGKILRGIKSTNA